MLILAIAGRRIDDGERAMLDDLAAVMAVADPRIWPLKLVRVVSAYGGCLAGLAAGLVNLEGALVGHPSTGRAAAVLVSLGELATANMRREGMSEELAIVAACHELVARGSRLAGFGVPFRRRDERVDMLTVRVEARGRAERPYWRLFARVTDMYRRTRNLEPNIGLAAGAVCLDMGFSLTQIGPIVTALGVSDLWCNAVEGAEQAPAILQSLPREHVQYAGPSDRVSPRASRAPRAPGRTV
jgi:citrate synthase